VDILLQDALVTGVALGAVILVARRVFGVFNPPAEGPSCSNCTSCPAPRQPVDAETPIPIALVRSGHESPARSHARR
jgi:hypothetical protein